MANVKISELPAATSLAVTDVFPAVNSGVTKQATFSLLPFLPSGTGAVATTVSEKISRTVSVCDFMSAAQIADAKAGTSSIDCSAAIQSAVTYAIANNFDLEVPYRLLMSSAVNIDRLVDGAAFDKYFRIWTHTGGGFYTTSLATLFTSSIAFTTAPVSQLVYFDGINFESSTASTRYVLSDGRFLRTRFHGCTFDKILCVNSSIYTQSMQFTNCNMRRGSGTFWTSTSFSYDFKFISNIIEAWTGNFLNLAQPVGGALLGNLMEGISGTAVIYNGAQGFAIHGNYFETNGLDIDGTGATQARGVAIIGNFFQHTNSAEYSVIWGNGAPVGCVSLGNFHNGSMHNVPSGADILIKDVASTNTQNNPVTPSILSASMALGTIGSTFAFGVSPLVVGTGQIHASANATLALTDAVLGTNYGGAIRGYGVGGQGGYVELGSFDAGTYTAHLIITQTGAARLAGSGPSLQVGSPTGGDKGSGTINAAGAYYANGTAGVASFGPSAVASITVKNGIITAIS